MRYGAPTIIVKFLGLQDKVYDDARQITAMGVQIASSVRTHPKVIYTAWERACSVWNNTLYGPYMQD